MASSTTARDLDARILFHELLLALIVTMQALDLFLTARDGVSATLLYGFGIITVVIWLRFVGLTVWPSVRDRLGRGVS